MKNMKNEEAVSPVIGVILMVVITVIIAAILAVFAFGIGSPVKTPEAKLRMNANTTGLYITHTGGDPLRFSDLQMTVDGADFGTAGQTMADYCFLPDGTTPATGLSVTKSVFCNPTPAFVADQVAKIQILHVPSGQIITDLDVGVTT